MDADLGGGQWCFGKSFDTFTPLGPVIATKAEIPDPQVLGVKTTLDGEVMQDSNTDDMVFTCAKIISFLSQDTTLLPGTVILTGTPFGVGLGKKSSVAPAQLHSPATLLPLPWQLLQPPLSLK